MLLICLRLYEYLLNGQMDSLIYQCQGTVNQGLGSLQLLINYKMKNTPPQARYKSLQPAPSIASKGKTSRVKRSKAGSTLTDSSALDCPPEAPSAKQKERLNKKVPLPVLYLFNYCTIKQINQIGIS